jgi:hypothetical protein
LKSSTSIAAFTPFLEETTFTYRFLQMFDVFYLWQFAVLSIGLGIIHRTGTKKSAATIFSLYVIIALLIAGIRQAIS